MQGFCFKGGPQIADERGETMNRDGKRESDEAEPVRMELKYCELCGGLWLRVQSGGEIYCEKCQPAVNELPVPKKPPQSERRRKLGARLPQGPREDWLGDLDDIEACWDWPRAAGEL